MWTEQRSARAVIAEHNEFASAARTHSAVTLHNALMSIAHNACTMRETQVVLAHYYLQQLHDCTT